MKRYKVINAYGFDELEDTVNQHIELGYEPLGAPIIIPCEGAEPEILQAVYLPKDAGRKSEMFENKTSFWFPSKPGPGL